MHVISASGRVEVPFEEVPLSSSPQSLGGEEHLVVRLYDTSGPGNDPAVGLPALRRAWMLARGDVAEYEGRRAVLRDDGRAAVRRAISCHESQSMEQPNNARPLRARAGKIVSQLHYARRGEVTAEMEFAALREGVEPELVRSEIA